MRSVLDYYHEFVSEGGGMYIYITYAISMIQRDMPLYKQGEKKMRKKILQETIEHKKREKHKIDHS